MGKVGSFLTFREVSVVWIQELRDFLFLSKRAFSLFAFRDAEASRGREREGERSGEGEEEKEVATGSGKQASAVVRVSGGTIQVPFFPLVRFVSSLVILLCFCSSSSSLSLLTIFLIKKPEIRISVLSTKIHRNLSQKVWGAVLFRPYNTFQLDPWLLFPSLPHVKGTGRKEVEISGVLPVNICCFA